MESETDKNDKINKASEVKTSPKDVFLHLLMIVTLLMSVVSFITLIFQYINVLFPDPLDYGNPYDTIRWTTAMLIVAFPVFIWVSYLIEKELQATPAKKEIGIRKWLIYLALFVAAIAIIIDLITLIFYFYGGDLTNQFLLKVVVVLVTAAAVFGYYRFELQREANSSDISRLWSWIVSAIVIGSIVVGFFIAGSPAEQRRIRLDAERISDIQQIQHEVVNYWQQNEELPADINELQDEFAGTLPTDPETEEEYEYTVTGELSFEICAQFQTDSSGRLSPRNGLRPVELSGSFENNVQNWEHDEGRTCFERTIAPDKLKPTR